MIKYNYNIMCIAGKYVQENIKIQELLISLGKTWNSGATNVMHTEHISGELCIIDCI